MKTLVVALMLAVVLPLAGQTKPAKKKPTPTPTEAPTPTPAVAPICRPENRDARRAAVELRIIADETPDANRVPSWHTRLAAAKGRFSGEIDMANGAKALRDSAFKVNVAYEDVTKSVNDLSYETLRRDLGAVNNGSVAAYGGVLTNSRSLVEALNGLLDCE